MLGDALAGRSEARLAATAAAFAEACGSPLSREAAARGLTADGRLIVVARTAAWAAQVEANGAALCAGVNARLGGLAVRSLEVRVGPLSG